MSAGSVIIDEPDQPDAPTLLAAYMVTDGYSGAEVQAYLDRRLPTRTLTDEEGEDLADTLFEALLGTFDRDAGEAGREAVELRDATVAWLKRHGVIA